MKVDTLIDSVYKENSTNVHISNIEQVCIVRKADLSRGTSSFPFLSPDKPNTSYLGSNSAINYEKLLWKITRHKKTAGLFNVNSPCKFIAKSPLDGRKAKNEETHEDSGDPIGSHCDILTGPTFLPDNAETSLFSEYQLSQDEIKNIRTTITKHFLFAGMNEEVLKIIYNELFYFIYDKNQTIYEQGDDGNFFYIVASGSVKATRRNEQNELKEKTYRAWECFGELSLITKGKREETLVTTSHVGLFSLDGESFRDIQNRLNETRLKDRYSFLNSIPIFQFLDNISKFNVAGKIKVREFKPNEKIISYGTVGDTLYIIKNGLVSCRIGVKEVRKLGNNDYFGQNSILIDMKRSCDVIALNLATCYELSRKDLIAAMGDRYIDVILFAFFKNCVENNNYFKNTFIESKMNELFKCFSINRYNYKEKVCSSSNKNKRIIIIIDGSIYKEKEDCGYELYARKGDIIGEELFKDLSKELRDDLLAYPDCISFESSFVDIGKVLGINVQETPELIKKNSNSNNKLDDSTVITKSPIKLLHRLSNLKKLNLFKHLSEKTLEIIAKNMTKKRYLQNEIIVREGTVGDSFYLISKGRVQVSVKDKVLRDLDSGSCFGEIALLIPDSKRTATVKAIDEKVICYVMCKDEFDKLIVDTNIKEYMKKKISLQDTSIELNDLYFIKFLGKGKFGNVNLVHNRKNFYAIKQVSRKSVEKQKILAKYFVNERRVMLSIDHPFIIKMVKSLRNELFCFFLMEYVDGKNLDEYLSKITTRKKNVEDTKFYIASILIMIEYLQNKLIAHRDIKPSNIMIDSNGYLKMIDFGTAKVLHDYTGTVIGTPHYISPEILQGKGYSLSCDFWSVGICMFEMFYGMYPFGHYANEVIEIYKEILHKDLVFPTDNPHYEKVNMFIRELLTKKVNLRVCNVNTLKTRPLFEGFEWDKLIDFQLKPPFIPGAKGLKDPFNTLRPFKEMILEDKVVLTRKEMEDSPPNYDKHWAEEF